MQVAIIKVINQLQNVDLKNEEENTEIDLDQEILDERKKQTLIQDFALKPFLSAAYKFSNSTTQ